MTPSESNHQNTSTPLKPESSQASETSSRNAALAGEEAVRELFAREWLAHKSLWLGGISLMVVVALAGAWIQGANPYWAGALYNLCTVALLASLCGFAALGLIWRTVKRISSELHFEFRSKFQLEASRALFKRSGILVFVVIAAEVVMYMLRLWAAH